MTASELVHRLLDASTTFVWVEVDGNGRIAEVNRGFAARIGVPAAELVGQPFHDFLAGQDAERARGWSGDGPVPADPFRVNFSTAQGAPFSLRCVAERDSGMLRIVGEPETEDDQAVSEELMRLNNEFATLVRAQARRERELERARRELEATLEDLRTSYWHLQKIQEVVPVCMECGKVKTDEFEWETVVDYLKANEIFLSHGYCPRCETTVLRRHGLDDDGP